MTTITAEEFKERLRTKGKVSNVRVEETIRITRNEAHPVSGSIRIINCEIGEIWFAHITLPSVIFRECRIAKLALETVSNFDEIKINDCAVTLLYLRETSCAKLTLTTMEGSTTSIEHGLEATINNLQLKGTYDRIELLSFRNNLLRLIDFTCNTIEVNNSFLPELNFKNVTADSIIFNYDGAKPDLVSIKNLKVRHFEIRQQYGKTLTLSEGENGGYYSASNIKLEFNSN